MTASFLKKHRIILLFLFLMTVSIGMLANHLLRSEEHNVIAKDALSLARRGSYPLADVMKVQPNTDTPEGTLSMFLTAMVSADLKTFMMLTSKQARDNISGPGNYSSAASNIRDYSSRAKQYIQNKETIVTWSDLTSNQLEVHMQTPYQVKEGTGPKYILSRSNGKWLIVDASVNLHGW